MIDFLKKRKTAFIAAFVAILAFLSALGIGFQNATAIVQLLIEGSYLATLPAWGLGIVVGGISSTIVNFCFNIELLESFWERLTGRKPMPSLSGGRKKLQWGLGIFVFVVTGILFGLTAVTISVTGSLAIVAIIAGIFVSLVMIPQELETWMQSFDDPVTLTIDKRIYDLKNSKDQTKIDEIFATLNTEIKELLLKEKLKKLKEKFAKEAEEASSKKQKSNVQVAVKVLNNLLLHLEKNKVNLAALIAQCEEINHQALRTKLVDELTALNEALIAKQEIIDSSISDKDLDGLKNQLFESVEEEISVTKAIRTWWRDLTPGRFVGLIISLGNVMALSLLFTIGLATFLTSMGVAALPALIVGFSVAFTFGAFTEFYFYHYFLADFCDQIVYRWNELIHSPKCGLGIALVVINGTINGVLVYFGVLLLSSLLVAAGIGAPPLLALAIVASIFAGVASLLLGSDFWIKSAKRFFSFGNSEEKPIHGNGFEDIPQQETLLLITEKAVEPSKELYEWILAPAQEYYKTISSSPVEFSSILKLNG